MKQQFLDLGKQPLANVFLDTQDEKEFIYDLRVGFDAETKLVTLMDYVDSGLMFNSDYTYSASMSETMKRHFFEVASLIYSQYFGGNVSESNLRGYQFDREVRLGFPSRKEADLQGYILEIGSNDGVFMNKFVAHENLVVGVEPCGNFSNITNQLGYKTYERFWNKETSEIIKKENGRPKVVFAANCICHIPDLDETFSAVEAILDDNGVFIFEDPSLLEMINRNSFDQIYDEHAHIFSVLSLNNILSRNNLTIIKVINTPVHGGSNIIIAKRTADIKENDIDPSVQINIDNEQIFGLDKFETFQRWSKKIEDNKIDLLLLLNNLKKSGKKVISYGATSKSTTVFNYCGIDSNLIEFILDTTPAKQGKFSPGMHIPVIKYSPELMSSVSYAFLGAWNFVEEIKNKESDYVKKGGKFLTHVPKIMMV